MNPLGIAFAIVIFIAGWFLLHKLFIWFVGRPKLPKTFLSYSDYVRDTDPSERSEIDRG